MFCFSWRSLQPAAGIACDLPRRRCHWDGEHPGICGTRCRSGRLPPAPSQKGPTKDGLLTTGWVILGCAIILMPITTHIVAFFLVACCAGSGWALIVSTLNSTAQSMFPPSVAGANIIHLSDGDVWGVYLGKSSLGLAGGKIRIADHIRSSRSYSDFHGGCSGEERAQSPRYVESGWLNCEIKLLLQRHWCISRGRKPGEMWGHRTCPARRSLSRNPEYGLEIRRATDLIPASDRRRSDA